MNKAIRNAENLGMKIISQKEVSNTGFMQVDGVTPVKGNNIQEYILIRNISP